MNNPTNVRVNLQALPNKLDLGIRILDQCRKALLNALNLLRNSAKNSLLETIELIETSPSSDLTQSDKDTAHSLEIERFITAENQDETT